MAAPAATADWLQELGEEVADARPRVYLVTFSRLLPETMAAGGGLRDLAQLSRSDVLEAVRDSFEQPVPTAAGGRPRQRQGPLVRKLVAFRETHSDGSHHFHVAVLLFDACRWVAAKRTLRLRHSLAGHFSCTHREWWSVLRYGVFPSEHKPHVDQDYLVWFAEGETCDVFAESQQPYNSKAWRGRREQKDKEAAAVGKPATFSKLDFTSLVLSEGLSTRAAVLRYVQDHGTEAMRAFTCKSQKRLTELLADAKEWQFARQVAAEEDLTDWALLCRAAEAECEQGAQCLYHQASEEILDGNAANWDRRHLAAALRKIIVAGPSKDTRVPFLVGTTNTGKSTLVESFDDLFGFERVFHLPAVTDSKYGLSNWLRDKRFVLWDEFDPVEFAHEGVFSISTFKKAFGGQYFEVQMAQNWHDGNKDFRWQRGVVFTNKAAGLWRPTDSVTMEDIRHLQSRVELFHCAHQVVAPGSRPRHGMIPQCRHHLAKWIREGAEAFDAAQGLLQMPRVASEAVSPAAVADLDQLLEAAKLPAPARQAISRDVIATGAVHVQELTRGDWEGLPSWASLKCLEQRRLLKLVPPN